MTTAQKSAPEGSNILCVDDDADILSIAQMSLEMMGGFTVVICTSGQEALEKLKEFKPDLILLDVMMPTMGGPDTLQEIRKLPDLSELPVIFMTARVQPDEIQSYLEMGAADVISKPFDPMTLPAQVRGILDRLMH